MSPPSKSERFEIFLERLTKAPPAATAEEARKLLEEVLNGVEDEFTDIPFDPNKFETDGRLYPPKDDAARGVDGYPAVTRFRSRAHNTFIAANGAIEIREIGGRACLVKFGADGNGVWT